MNRGQVYSVSAINRFIKDMFSNEYALSVVFVKGEISNCKYHSSGHVYFTLKDASSSLACVIFAGDRRGLSFRLSDGQEVVIGGTINVYERDGKYQLYAKKITLAGDGVLYEKYEQLKRKLEEKGYFDEKRKKPIPRYVKRVGIVTAQTGAAVQDMMQIAARRNPYVQLILYPAKVQGEGASDTIVEGIRRLDRHGVDVIIVGRGGGSIEDLWAFNEEKTAQAIFACQTPVVSAVGHETDTTIADYVADLRAPTPSAAAELVVYDVRQALEQLYGGKERLMRNLFDRIDAARLDLSHMNKMLKSYNPESQMRQKRQYVTDMEDKLSRQWERILNEKKHRLQLLAGRLDGLSPLKRLSGGFAYVADEKGMRVDRAEMVKPGDVLEITWRDGSVRAEVTKDE
ncbi:MAG: exodeoxyribonuclease VII large subunit [Eubacterium sp.]|nr:exodeoxyribonuclease VII large subunit [Eubacterium sp.]